MQVLNAWWKWENHSKILVSWVEVIPLHMKRKNESVREKKCVCVWCGGLFLSLGSAGLCPQLNDQ